MKIKKFLNTWFDKEIEDWGGETSPEYKKFQRDYKSVLKELGKSLDFELCTFHPNHYDFCAVMKSNLTNQFYYISISDVRCFKNDWADNILYRTMDHEQDWSGGSNHFSTLEGLANNLLRLDKQKLKNNELREMEFVL